MNDADHYSIVGAELGYLCIRESACYNAARFPFP